MKIRSLMGRNLPAMFFVAVALALPSASRAEPMAGDAAGREVSIDTLFDRLREAPDAMRGKAIEDEIHKLWLQSGSPSIDLLMARGIAAEEAGDNDRAYFYFNEITILMPGYAEGWNRRARISWLKKNYTAALKDLEHTLRLMPRHFVAMTRMAEVMRVLGDRRAAEDLLRRAYAVNPFIEFETEDLPASKARDSDI